MLNKRKLQRILSLLKKTKKIEQPKQSIKATEHSIPEKRIFFSYSRADAEDFTLKLANDLNQAGANIWIDQLNLRGGEKYNVAIEKALESSSHILFIVSEKSISSQYVMDEVNYAIDESKVVIPVIIYDCKLWLRLRGLQKIDFTQNYEKGLNALLASLNIDKGQDRTFR